MLGHHARCITGMRPWQELARREEHQLPAQASEFYSQLGRCQYHAGQYDAARLMFERSLVLRRDPLQNEAGVVENLVDLDRMHEATGDTARAQEELRRALAQLHARIGDSHPMAVDILGSLCKQRSEE